MRHLHLLLVEDISSIQDRSSSRMDNSYWNSKPRYLLNKLLILLNDAICLTSCTLPSLPNHIGQDIDIVLLHVDISVISQDVVEKITKLAGNRPIINGRLVDTTKKTIDKNRPQGSHSLIVPPNAKTGLVIIKSNYNSGDAPERVYKRLNLENLDSNLRSRTDLVKQYWIQDYRSGSSGIYTLERYIYLLGDITVCEISSQSPIVKRPLSYCTYIRQREYINDDIRLMRDLGIEPGGIPWYWNGDKSFWESRLSILRHYSKRLWIDLASIEAIQSNYNKFEVIDINKTPWERGLPIKLLTLLAAQFHKKLYNLIQGKKR